MNGNKEAALRSPLRQDGPLATSFRGCCLSLYFRFALKKRFYTGSNGGGFLLKLSFALACFFVYLRIAPQFFVTSPRGSRIAPNTHNWLRVEPNAADAAKRNRKMERRFSPGNVVKPCEYTKLGVVRIHVLMNSSGHCSLLGKSSCLRFASSAPGRAPASDVSQVAPGNPPPCGRMPGGAD